MKPFLSKFGIVLALPVLVSLIGCSKPAPPEVAGKISGKVSLNGTPTSDIMIVFNPVDAAMQSATATSGDGGAYEVEIFGGGQYKVTFSSMDLGGGESSSDGGTAGLIPEAYTLTEKTPITIDVSGGSQTRDFDIPGS